MLIDSHAHLNFTAYDEDRDKVIKRCQDRGMKVINVGSQVETSRGAIKLADKTDGFFASVAIHPVHVGKYERDDMETKEYESVKNMDLESAFSEIEKLAQEDKVVAIGETGLDYFRIDSSDQKTKDLQKKYFIKHLDLAEKNNLPVIFHCRGSKDNPLDVYKEVLEIIESSKKSPSPSGLRRPMGVIHCFGANLEIAKKFIAKGIYIGLTGIITFAKHTEELQEVAKKIPLNYMLIETDCPYLAPEPHRGKRNEPVYVELVAKKIAQLRGISIEEVIEKTGENAQKLFKI